MPKAEIQTLESLGGFYLLLYILAKTTPNVNFANFGLVFMKSGMVEKDGDINFNQEFEGAWVV